MAASYGVQPFSSMYLKMFSSTTIASSMTMPTASVRASSVMLFSVKSIARISVNVAMIDAGMASDEMTTARMLRMKNMTTTAGQQLPPDQVLFERGHRGVDEARIVAVIRSATRPSAAPAAAGAAALSRLDRP